MDWTTVSALATAGGTLVLAGTTYASVRSANRAARVAEQSLLAGLRPLVIQSSDEVDPPIHVGFANGMTVTVPGGGAAVEVVEGRRDDDRRDEVLSLVESGRFAVELLYGDFDGGQRMVTRFGVSLEDDGRWRCAVARHWQLDRPSPR